MFPLNLESGLSSPRAASERDVEFDSHTKRRGDTCLDPAFGLVSERYNSYYSMMAS